MAMWNRCAICGRAIPVGELCYGIKNWCGDPVGGDTICRDCLVPENAPTLIPPNEWVEALKAINNAAVAYIEGGPYENDLPGMELAVEIDRLSRDFVRPPNEPLTLEQLREMDEVPIYVVTEKRGKGWCILSWHGVNKSFTFFSKTGTSEGMTAVPLSTSTYGDRWLAYLRPPEGKED